ncbi:MAG: hypothetical protein IJ337_06685 [Clostridia bacterium]|nr:hypothetical protein [Clostridia bacterium]
MASPVFNRMNRRSMQRQGMQNMQQDGNNPQFMQFANQLNEFGRGFQGDPEQMIMGALNDGRISKKQFEMVQGMAKKIQSMLVNMGF